MRAFGPYQAEASGLKPEMARPVEHVACRCCCLTRFRPTGQTARVRASARARASTTAPPLGLWRNIGIATCTCCTRSPGLGVVRTGRRVVQESGSARRLKGGGGSAPAAGAASMLARPGPAAGLHRHIWPTSACRRRRQPRARHSRADYLVPPPASRRHEGGRATIIAAAAAAAAAHWLANLATHLGRGQACKFKHQAGHSAARDCWALPIQVPWPHY